MIKVLIIDDDKQMSQLLARVVKDMGFHVDCAHCLADGFKTLHSSEYDVVMLDVQLPDGVGLEAIPTIKELSYSPEVIIITGMGDPDGAELAITSGAWDYIEKPASVKQMTLPLMRAIQYRDGRRSKPLPLMFKRDRIIGNSQRLTQILDRLAHAATSNVNVLITGETGSGKELFAEAIHNNSDRADNPFVVVDCAALPESLVESILFGHEKGAFSGAERAREGLVKQADGGTLFLDEIGELPLSIQKSFLRVLQERKYRPVGSGRIETSDFRLVAATNRDLVRMVQDGRFRKDLLFRLRAIEIEIPSLRERGDDIVELVLYYTSNFCRIYNMDKKGFSPDFIDAVTMYDWPGNVRELVNTMEQVVVDAQHEPILFSYHLPTKIRATLAKKSLAHKLPHEKPRHLIPLFDSDNIPLYRDFKEEMEHRYLANLIKAANGIKKEACAMSGLSRPRLYELLKKHSL